MYFPEFPPTESQISKVKVHGVHQIDFRRREVKSVVLLPSYT